MHDQLVPAVNASAEIQNDSYVSFEIIVAGKRNECLKQQEI